MKQLVRFVSTPSSPDELLQGHEVVDEEFEAIAITLKEQATLLLQDQAALAAVAKDGGAARWLAGLWGCSTSKINLLARIFDTFPLDLITPDIPTSLFRAALDTDDPVTWLKRAIAEGWSSRQLRDAADVAKGRRESRVPWLDGECYDVMMDCGLVSFIPVDTPSGEVPTRLRVRAVEVLGDG